MEPRRQRRKAEGTRRRERRTANERPHRSRIDAGYVDAEPAHKRTKHQHLRLDERQRLVLEETARDEHTTITSLVRTIVESWLMQRRRRRHYMGNENDYASLLRPRRHASVEAELATPREERKKKLRHPTFPVTITLSEGNVATLLGEVGALKAASIEAVVYEVLTTWIQRKYKDYESKSKPPLESASSSFMAGRRARRRHRRSPSDPSAT